LRAALENGERAAGAESEIDTEAAFCLLAEPMCAAGEVGIWAGRHL